MNIKTIGRIVQNAHEHNRYVIAECIMPKGTYHVLEVDESKTFVRKAGTLAFTILPTEMVCFKTLSVYEKGRELTRYNQ